MHGHSFDQGALMKVWIPQLSIYTRVLCYRWSYYGCSISYDFLASWLSVSGICHYIEEQGERSIGHLVVVVAITMEQF